MLWDVAIALCVLRWGRRAPEGALMPLALAAWAAGRSFIAFVRVDPVTFGLQQGAVGGTDLRGGRYPLGVAIGPVATHQSARRGRADAA